MITFEGGEGAGKSTQARLLTHAMRTAGMAVLDTREPGGAPGAEIVRALLLSGEADWSPSAETLLHFAARAEHVARTIRPALAAGQWVVCDRFADSTMAYQGYGQGADRGAIATLTTMIGIAPDLTIVLDVPDDLAVSRLLQRGRATDRYERMETAFHARVRDGFRRIAAAEPARCAMIDGSAAPDRVHIAVLEAVSQRLGRVVPAFRDPA